MKNTRNIISIINQNVSNPARNIWGNFNSFFGWKNNGYL